MTRIILLSCVLLAAPALATEPPSPQTAFEATLQTRRDALQSSLPTSDMIEHDRGECDGAREDFKSATRDIATLRTQLAGVTKTLKELDVTLPGAEQYRADIEQSQTDYAAALQAAESRLTKAKTRAKSAGQDMTKMDETSHQYMAEISRIDEQLARLNSDDDQFDFPSHRATPRQVEDVNVSLERPLTPLPEEFRVCFPKEVLTPPGS